MTDAFTFTDAVRRSTPLLLGLMGASGSGKTFSALRLATGIQSVTGGDIFGIDTEARRMLHYADRFKFKHLDFRSPFSPERYLAAIQAAVGAGGKIIVVDSMSHEHEGPGGVLEMHEEDFEKFGSQDKNNFRAWQRPKNERRKMINGILQMDANFIFCFRAKEKIKLVGGKPVPQGFMPIAGEEFIYEMTANALLMPQSRGVPTWQSSEVGERKMIKEAEQFKALFREPRPLDEDTGVALARWAQGEDRPDPLPAAREAAKAGKDALQAHWKALDKPTRALVHPIMDELTKTATEADASHQPATEDVI